MSRPLIAILCLTTYSLLGLPVHARGEDTELKRLFDRTLRSVALVFAAEPDKDRPFLAGAVLLDRHERMLLTTARDLPDQVRVMLPEYTEKGVLKNTVGEYRDRAASHGRAGKVLHRDKNRNLAVIQLEKPLPASCLWIELAAESSRPGDRVFRVGGTGAKEAWTLSEGHVRSVAVERDVLDGIEVNARLVATTAMPEIAPAGPICDSGGRLVAFPTFNSARAWNVTKHLDVSEVQAFLKEKKVPYMQPPKEEVDPEVERLRDKALKSVAYVAVTNARGEIVRQACGAVIHRDQRLVLTVDVEGAKEVKVVFPLYEKDGRAVRDIRRYQDEVKKTASMTGQVLHSHKARNLSVVRLDKPLPLGVAEIPLAEKVAPGTDVCRLGLVDGQPEIWRIVAGKVRAIGFERYLWSGPTPPSDDKRYMVTASIPAVGKEEGLLLNRNGQLAGLLEGATVVVQVSVYIHVSEIRTFLTEMKIKLSEPSAGKK